MEMGGRGASSSERPHAGGDGPQNFSRFGVGDVIPGSGGLKKAIGKKRKTL